MKVKGAAIGMFHHAIGTEFNLHQECINLDKGSTVKSVYNGHCVRQTPPYYSHLAEVDPGGGNRGSASPPPPPTLQL